MERWPVVFFLISFLEVQLLVARRCPEPTKHYTTIGCIPSEQQTSAGCPRWFDCSELAHRTSDKCYLYGQVYQLNDQVPDGKIRSTCSALCTCQRNAARGVAEFHCAHIDCPEFLTPPNRTGCVRQYRVRECCATRQVCGEKKAHLIRCTHGDTRYYEGERMNFADDPCRTCICTEHFNATDPLSDTKCFTNDCPFELISPSVLMSGAAPVYYNNGCCPWEWRMPKPEDRLGESGNGASSVARSLPYRCRYGNLTLLAGQSLVPDVTATGTYECKCAIPPMIHCILKAT
uniref:Putative secreted protein n=2 Tax=Anopheles marajoara TaxID=58244 RepID=A0A2M4BWS8_9DIPT